VFLEVLLLFSRSTGLKHVVGLEFVSGLLRFSNNPVNKEELHTVRY